MSIQVAERYEPVYAGVTPQQIADLYARRRLARGPELARMAEVQRMIDGDLVVPLPELNKNERDSVPNRADQGLKQFAQRIASALPNIWCPPLRPGFDNSEKRARDRRKAMLGWWTHSRLHLQLRQRARYLQGYGASPVRIFWDLDTGVPMWRNENPLSMFPSVMHGPQDMCPEDCIIERFESLGWLYENYPGPTTFLYKGGRPGSPPNRDQIFTLLEYVDDDECVLIALGAKPDEFTTPAPGSMTVELDRYPNRAGRCPIVIPRQIVLNRLKGQFDGMAGMHQTEAMLMAMSIIATKKGVFQDEWLVAHPNEQPEIIQIPKPDGTPGIVKGGALVPRGVDPQFQTNMTIDRLAAAQLQQSGMSSELQGLAPTNVRTGVRATELLSNVIDFPIQEAQELFAESLQEENRIAVAFAKNYGGTKSFYVNWNGTTGPVTYQPDTTFETDQNIVTYPLAGADQAGLVISSGQRVGMGTLSKQGFMEIDPMIKDVEVEQDRITAEKLDDALLAGLAQQLASGQLPPVDGARIRELIATDAKELFEAVITAHQEAQARQATPAPPGAPETQPGLGGPAQQPQIGPSPDTQGLASLLQSLRTPQRMTPQEVMAGGASAGGGGHF